MQVYYQLLTSSEWDNLKQSIDRRNRSTGDKQPYPTHVKFFYEHEYKPVAEYCVKNPDRCKDLQPILRRLGLKNYLSWNGSNIDVINNLTHSLFIQHAILIQTHQTALAPLTKTYQPVPITNLAFEHLVVKPYEEEEQVYLTEDYRKQQEQKQRFNLIIGLFFDGTGNNANNTETREKYDLSLLEDDSSTKHINDTSYQNERTNVHKLFEMYERDRSIPLTNNREKPIDIQMKIYITGAGTKTGESDSNLGLGMGRYGTGIQAKINECLSEINIQINQLLIRNPQTEIQRLEFDIVGFSRGAATARYFANIVADNLWQPKLKKKAPLGDKNPLTKILNPILQERKSPKWHCPNNGRVKFLGLFDTVAGINGVMNWFDASDANTFDIDISIDLKTVDVWSGHCCQIVAANEYRHNFALNAIPAYFETIVLPGAHSDIGGGYPNYSIDEDLYIIPVKKQGSLRRPYKETDTQLYRQLQEKVSWFRQHPDLKYLFADTEFKFYTWVEENSQNNSIHDLYGTIRATRTVKYGWDRIPLLIMMIKLQAQRRRLADMNEQDIVPRALVPITGKIIDAVMYDKLLEFTEQEKHFILSQYVHCSAEYDRKKGLIKETILKIDEETGKEINVKTATVTREYARGDLIVVHKPHEDWIRQIHPNEGK